MLNRKRARSLALLALALLAAAGCAAPPSAVAQSELPRDTAPAVAPASRQALAEGNTDFALDLYQSLRAQDGNLFFSPYSLSAALAMTYAGARGNTESQMAQVLHYTLPQADLHPAFNALDLDLNAAGGGSDSGSFTLKTASSLWGQQDFTFLPAFLDVLGRNYGAGLRLADFKNDAPREQARLAINAWTKDATAGKIPELLDKGVLTQDTRLVLANAIYFQGKWVTPFFPNTPEAPFGRLDGITVTVPMMGRRAQTPFAEGPGYQAVELPYKGDRVSMLILLPDSANFEAFELSLTDEKIAGILAALQPTDVKLYLPRFKYDASLDLVDTLSALGMPDAFDWQRADFSGITGEPTLVISHVIHKAYVAVDELGTEAAAATGIIAEIVSMPRVVEANHPFMYFILDRETGTLLFLGRVLDPTQ
jgi:serpin B